MDRWVVLLLRNLRTNKIIIDFRLEKLKAIFHRKTFMVFFCFSCFFLHFLAFVGRCLYGTYVKKDIKKILMRLERFGEKFWLRISKWVGLKHGVCQNIISFDKFIITSNKLRHIVYFFLYIFFYKMLVFFLSNKKEKHKSLSPLKNLMYCCVVEPVNCCTFTDYHYTIFTGCAYVQNKFCAGVLIKSYHYRKWNLWPEFKS